MKTIDLKIKRLHRDAILPTYATDGAACFDLYALGGTNRMTHAIYPGDKVLFPTGLAFEVPPGWALMIYSRSGHGFNNDIRLANCVGVIDSDYRGEVLVKLTSDQHLGPFGLADAIQATCMAVRAGDRIAQAMLVPAPRVAFVEVDELTTTTRGTGGFGSTGQ